MGKNPEIKFDFRTLNPKRHQWAPKWAKAHGVKFEFGAQRWGKAPKVRL
jgi:hypothetical protein